MTLLAFLHPGLVWAAALLAIPLIIHLLNRRRFRPIPWAAMDFLLQAYKKKRKRLQLENLLLLLLRCAIPVILALAFARPYFGADSILAGLAESRREIVALVDESYSMSRRQGTGTQFQLALEQVRRLVASLDFERGDRVSLLTLAREPRLLCVSAGKDDLERRLATLQRPSYEAADFGRTLDVLLEDVLKQIPAAPEVWLFSDFQRRSFDPAFTGGPEAPGSAAAASALKPLDVAGDPAAAGSAPAGLLGKLQRLSQQCRLHLINLSDGSLPPENMAVTELRASEPLALAGQSVRLTATVTRQGRATGGSGRFRVGDRERPVTFNLSAQGKATAEIYHSFATAGDVGVEFRLDEDELPDDDARFLRMPVKANLPILIVDGAPGGGDPLQGGAWNVMLILDPLFGDTEAEGYLRYFDPTPRPWYDLSRTKPDFAKYDAVVFVNVREIEGERVLPELRSYVESGGGVLFFLGDEVRADAYNERLYRADGTGLMPLRLMPEPRGQTWTASSSAVDLAAKFFRLEIADELHPAVRTFNDDRRRGFLRSPVFRYWPFEWAPPAGTLPGVGNAAPASATLAGALPSDSRVVLRYEEGGDPALIEHRVGRGRLLWFNISAAEDDWSNFSRTSGAFFPLLWDMLNHLAVRDPGEHELAIGGVIAKGLLSPPASWAITPPDGRARAFTDVPREAVRGLYRLPAFGDTRVPGLYALDLQPGGDDPPLHEVYAVNVDARESDLTFLDREQVGSLFERVTIASYGREVPADVREQAPERQGEIWRRLILLLLAMLVVESLLAWRFGSYQKP